MYPLYSKTKKNLCPLVEQKWMPLISFYCLPPNFHVVLSFSRTKNVWHQWKQKFRVCFRIGQQWICSPFKTFERSGSDKSLAWMWGKCRSDVHIDFIINSKEQAVTIFRKLDRKVCDLDTKEGLNAWLWAKKIFMQIVHLRGNPLTLLSTPCLVQVQSRCFGLQIPWASLHLCYP